MANRNLVWLLLRIENRRMSSVATVRVLVVEDFREFRQLICLTLGKRRDLQVIGEVADGLEAVRNAAELRPDLILMDIGLPSLNGIEAARQILRVVPQAKIIFVSQESDPGLVQGAMSVGARGYIQKMKARTELLAGIDEVIAERRFVRTSEVPSVRV
jgi:DNA-binding NarL/FixJ family response regulator